MGEQAVLEQWMMARQEREEIRASIVDVSRWEQIERTLQSDLPPWLLDKCLRLYGTTLAEFVPIGYNYKQVARDSDGPMSNNQP